jgi:PAS domain S-box-containing protein
MAHARILIVEDETIVAMDIEQGLKGLGYKVTGMASTGEEAIRLTQQTRPDLVLMDIQLRGDMNGIEAAQQIHEKWGTPVIFLTAYADEKTVQQAANVEPFGYLLKPFEDRELHTAIEVALHKHASEQATIEEAEQALHASEERYRQLVENLQDYAIAILDRKGRITTWNTGAERLSGYRADEVIGEHFTMFDPPESRSNPEQILWRALREGSLRQEGWRVRKDGSRFWADIVLTVLRDQQGGLQGFADIMRDMTERKRAEEEIRLLNSTLESRVQDRTRALTFANGELEAFSYSIAHDLRGPLRGIAGWLDYLRLQLGQISANEAREYIARSIDSAQRMDQLINDLLKLSQVGAKELTFDDCDLNSIASQVIAELTPQAQGRQIEWNVEPLPLVKCDTGLLKQVFYNLFSNSIKYTKDRPQAVIHVGQSECEGQSCLFVQDNGIGFDMRYASDLFVPFHRLHNAREFEGTGVGLALVQRVVQRHGGRVWAEGKVDEGATFYFALPRKGHESAHRR